MKLFRPESNPRRLVAQLIWFGVWLFATAFGLYLRPDGHGHGTHQQLGLPPCPSVLLFDRPCPGCGLTTSWTALLHGDFALAFHAHPLGPVLYALLTATAFLTLYGWRKQLLLQTDTTGFTHGFAAGFAVFLAFGAFRAFTTPHFQSPQERLLSRLSSEMQSQPDR